jgi:hypothetical protein
MIALALALTLAQAPARLALAVGSNEGAEGRDALWFAEADARRFADALIELGQFEPKNVTVLSSPSSLELTRALLRLAAQAREALDAGHPPLLIFYYSGHADPTGLELGKERFLYGDLANALSVVPEGVRIAILDACHSGALTQVKGARPAPLDFEVVREPRADGVAFITSSSASEKAQESAQLGGSFFTHHLVAGLRGAADADRDGRVTLAETYRYAYHRTLATTSETGASPQHPTWAMRMSGKGEVVLVDLRDAHAWLSFSAGLSKSYLVTNARTQEVVAEVVTGAEALKVALPEGQYRVERLSPAPRLSGSVELPANGGVVIDDGQLTEVPVLASRAKGDVELSRRTDFLGAEVWLGSPVMHNFGAGYGVGLSFRHDFERLSLMLGLTYSQKLVDDLGFTYRYHAGTAEVGLAGRVPLKNLALLFGAKLGASYALQVLPDGSQTNDFIFLGGPIAGVAVPVFDHFAVRALAGATAQTFKLNGAQVARFAVELTLAVEWAP